MFDAVEFALERAGIERVPQADLQPLGAGRLDHEINRARPHRRYDVINAAMGGLHDDRHFDRRLAKTRQHAESVEIWHHQIEDDAIDPPGFRSRQQRQRRLAAVNDDGLVSELLQHGIDKPALHRIIVDNEYGHLSPAAFAGRGTLCRFGAISRAEA